MKYSRNRTLFFLIPFLLSVCACSVGFDDEEKIRDISFAVLEEKQEAFCLTFGDEEWLYLARGYGEKETGGYSVEVAECYESANAICLKTRLLGPSRDEGIPKGVTYPRVVVKMEYCDKNVLFY